MDSGCKSIKKSEKCLTSERLFTILRLQGVNNRLLFGLIKRYIRYVPGLLKAVETYRLKKKENCLKTNKMQLASNREV